MPKRLCRHYIVLAGLLVAHVVTAADISTETEKVDSADATLLPVKTRNPLLTGSLSAVIPGAGQIYTGHFIKAGSFVALEAITASVARFWYRTTKQRNDLADQYGQLSLIALGKTESLSLREQSLLLRFNAVSARYSMYNTLSWMVGGYVYNILDALGSSRYFFTEDEKSPSKAAWLSAIPGLGLGQLYNHAPGKAGLIMMTQVSLGVKAVNEHRLMRKAEHGLTVLSRLSDSSAVDVKDEFEQNWVSRRETAFKNRNSYLWYSLAFYFYGILDALVDAHLHDYPKKMRAYPDLIGEQSAAGITVEYIF